MQIHKTVRQKMNKKVSETKQQKTTYVVGDKMSTKGAS